MRTRWGSEFRLWDGWFRVLTRNVDICHKTGIFGWLRVELMWYCALPRVNSFFFFFLQMTSSLWFKIWDIHHEWSDHLWNTRFPILNPLLLHLPLNFDQSIIRTINQSLLSADQGHHSSLPDDWCRNPRLVSPLVFSLPEARGRKSVWDAKCLIFCVYWVSLFWPGRILMKIQTASLASYGLPVVLTISRSTL